jgi:hypothetical protein
MGLVGGHVLKRVMLERFPWRDWKIRVVVLLESLGTSATLHELLDNIPSDKLCYLGGCKKPLRDEGILEGAIIRQGVTMS